MKQGDIVFIPFKNGYWPGVIIDINYKATVKCYKIKDQFKVERSELIPFSAQKCQEFAATQIGDKTFSTAIKSAKRAATILEKKSPKPDRPKGQQQKQQTPNKSYKEEWARPKKEEEDDDERVRIKGCEQDDGGRVVGEYANMVEYLEEQDLPRLIQTAQERRPFLCVYYDSTKEREVRSWIQADQLVLSLASHLLDQQYFLQPIHIVERNLKKIHRIINSGLVDLHAYHSYSLQPSLRKVVDELSEEGSRPCDQKMLSVLTEWSKKLDKMSESFYQKLMSRSQPLRILDE